MMNMILSKINSLSSNKQEQISTVSKKIQELYAKKAFPVRDLSLRANGDFKNFIYRKE